MYLPVSRWPYFGSRRQYSFVMLLISMVTFLRLFWLDARSSAFSPILLRGRSTSYSNNRAKPWSCKACKSFNTTQNNHLTCFPDWVPSVLFAWQTPELTQTSNHSDVECFRQSTECLHLLLTPPPQVCLRMHGNRAQLHDNYLFLNKKTSSFAKFESSLCRLLSCTVTDTTPFCSSVCGGLTVWGWVKGKLFVHEFHINMKYHSLYVFCREVVIQCEQKKKTLHNIIFSLYKQQCNWIVVVWSYLKHYCVNFLKWELCCAVIRVNNSFTQC